MSSRTKALHVLLAETWTKWRADDAAGAAAALAYYALFAIVPLLITVLATAAMVFGTARISRGVGTVLDAAVGPDAAGLVLNIIAATARQQNASAWTLLAVLAVIGALSIFEQLKKTLDRMWGGQREFRRGRYFEKDAWLFILVLLSGFMLAYSALASTLAVKITDSLGVANLPVRATFFLADTVAAWAITTILVLLIYHFVPAVRFRLRDLALGAIWTSVFLTLGRAALTFYLQSANLGSIYGAAGIIILLLLWIYFSAQIFYFGAEFTYVYAKKRKLSG